jgi:hypothetical protein
MSWQSGFMVEGNGTHGWSVAIFAKRSYTIGAGAVRVADEQQPLYREAIYGPAINAFTAPLLAPSDLTGAKASTDVVVKGSGCAPRGKQVYYLDCSVEVGRAYTKRVRVFGKRHFMRGLFGQGHFSHPQPFARLQLDYCNAYGGSAPDRHGVLYTHPANPLGSGFALRGAKGMSSELVVPRQEDPAHPLDPTVLQLRRFEHWRRMPQPASLGWVAPNFFPRAAFWGAQPQQLSCKAAPGAGVDPRAWQGASTGLWGKRLRGDEAVRLRYFDADRAEFCFSLPADKPSLTLDTGSGPQAASPPQLETVSIDMEQKVLSLVWRAEVACPGIEQSAELKAFAIAVTSSSRLGG